MGDELVGLLNDLLKVHYSKVGKTGLALFFCSALAVLALFRISDSIWPIYLLIALGVIHLYAVIFSQGEALTSATFVFFTVSLLWGLWELADWFASQRPASNFATNFWRPLHGYVTDDLVYIPLVVWIIATIWGIALGRSQALPGLKLASGYFLGLGAFIFGLWGAWGFLIENRLVRSWLFQAAIVLALVVPLLLLISLIEYHPPEERTPGAWPQLAALWFLLITAYLLSTQVLTDLVERGLGHFLPQILGLHPLSNLELD